MSGRQHARFWRSAGPAAGAGLVLALAFAGVLSAATATAGETAGITERSYAIYRNGSDIGTRRLSIARKGDRTEVVNETTVAVKVAVITAYRRHELLREVWQGDRMTRFTSEVDDDGKHFGLTMKREGNDALRVEGAVAGDYTAAKEALPASYWSSRLTHTGEIIHVMRGNVQRVAFARVGEEKVTVAGQTVQATHYSMTGDEQAELWYDAGGIIVRGVFHDDGAKIEFLATNLPAPVRQSALP